ncbi:TIGR01212 family radical SAM protein [Planctomycetota bacterium]|nr:TIGR01212 family radical SAM protein [Planctomycetota bacterium]
MPQTTAQPYLSFKNYLADRYGQSLYRIPIDLDFGCPNRNKDGSGGCTFCSLDGSRAVQTLNQITIEQQIVKAKDFAQSRYDAKSYIAYFQAYTSTFAPLSKQREYYESVIKDPSFKAVSIGTRPDCLSKTVINYLAELNQTIDVWIELGLQTIHDDTLDKINRGHDWACSRDAILRLNDAGLKTAAHVILGLPGETPEHYKQTAETLAQLPIHAVKIHNLHILKNTAMADDYAQDKISVLHPFEYGNHVIDFMRRTPADRPMMRVMTDTSDEQLIAPRWSISKGQFMTWLHTQMQERQVEQGDLVKAIENKALISQLSDKTQSSHNISALMIGSFHAKLMQSQIVQEQRVSDWKILDFHKQSIDEIVAANLDVEFCVSINDPRYSFSEISEGSCDFLLWNTNAIAFDSTYYSGEFLKLAADKLKDEGCVIMCTRDRAVIAIWQQLGFHVYQTMLGNIYSILVTRHKRGDLDQIQGTDISQKQHSSVCVPYHDPDLCWPHSKIIRSREQAIQLRKNI